MGRVRLGCGGEVREAEGKPTPVLRGLEPPGVLGISALFPAHRSGAGREHPPSTELKGDVEGQSRGVAPLPRFRVVGVSSRSWPERCCIGWCGPWLGRVSHGFLARRCPVLSVWLGLVRLFLG